jgi:tetratricopeptide (TPR) repeat protein
VKWFRSRSRTRNSCLCLLLWSVSSAAQTPTVQSNVEKAEQAFNAGRYAEALDLFQRAEAASPSCELHFYVGMTQYRLQRLDEAISSFASSVACDPRFALGERALGDAYGTKGNDNRALAAYEAVLKIQPDDPETLRAASRLDIKHELNARALPLLERYVKLQANDVEARADLGSVYAALGQYDKAEQQFHLALRWNPQSAAAVLGLGGLDLKRNRTEQAVSLLSKAAKLAPDAAKPYYLLGLADNRLGRYAEATAALEQAASRSPDDADTYYQLAHAYGHLGRREDKAKAIARFTEIKTRDEKLFESRQEAARLAIMVQQVMERQDVATALQMMEKAHQLDPENEEVWFRLASLYYDSQKYELARDFAERLVVRAPSEWRYRYVLGQVQIATGQWDEARASLERVVQFHPSAAEVYNDLGNLAMKESKPAEAIKAYEQAAKMNPENRGYKENLEAAKRAGAHQN